MTLCKNHLAGKTTNKPQPITTSKMYNVLIPLPELANVTLKANNIQPTTSFVIPAAKTIVPTRSFNNLNSVKILANTGKAVIHIATAMKTI